MFKPRTFTDTIIASVDFLAVQPPPLLVLMFDQSSGFWTTMDCNHIPHIIAFQETNDVAVIARLTPGIISAFIDHPCPENIAHGICDAHDQRRDPRDTLDLVQIAADAPFELIVDPEA